MCLGSTHFTPKLYLHMVIYYFLCYVITKIEILQQNCGKGIKNIMAKFVNKKSCYIGKNVKIGKNVVIHANNHIGDNVEICDNVTLLPNNVIEGAVIKNGASVGPFARIRPNSVIGENCKIGNFVEIKNSVIGCGCKISHLAYVGDVQMGADCNIGCGVIFANYDGKNKHKTTLGDHVFVGSNCNIIAPVQIEDSSYICAGTTVVQNVKAGDFVIGRVRQENKAEKAKKYW